MTEENKDPQGQSANDPSKVGEGQSTKQPEVNQDDLPEQFKGKSAKEIASSYIELQKKLGEHSTELSQARQSQQEITYWRQIGQLIHKNPALYKLVEQEIQNATDPEKSKDKKDSKEESRTQVDTDTRTATSGLILGEFERNIGIDRLPEEKKAVIRQKIGDEIATLLDPKGLKSKQDVFNSIPLDILPKYLEKGYKLATDGDREERARSQAYIEARQNNDATFGDIPNAGVRTSSKSLSDKEREVARKMGMSEEDYLKNK